MSVVAFIFARGGSKGLPDKNLRKILGKPLISLAIEQALTIKKIDRVIVSTDSPKIADIAKKSGAEVPFIRPKDLALDDSPEWLAWQHAMMYLQNNLGSLPDAVVSIPTTAPLRISEDIENCIDRFFNSKVDVVITVTEARRSPYFNMVEIDPFGIASLAKPFSHSLHRRQEAPKMYDMTTVAYVFKPDFILNNNSIFEGVVASVEVPVERSIDIDTLLDFEIAEFLLARRF